jgi:hypothetical protein
MVSIENIQGMHSNSVRMEGEAVMQYGTNSFHCPIEIVIFLHSHIQCPGNRRRCCALKHGEPLEEKLHGNVIVNGLFPFWCDYAEYAGMGNHILTCCFRAKIVEDINQKSC